jgi:hypothetical protein
MTETAKYVKGKKPDAGRGGTGVHHHSAHTEQRGKQIRKCFSYLLSLKFYGGYETQSRRLRRELGRTLGDENIMNNLNVIFPKS